MSKLLNRRGCKLIAHRGASHKAPENSLPAFEIAGQSNYFGIESDIQTTSDHHYLMIHDHHLDRLTTGTGVIKTMTNEEVTKHHLAFGHNIEHYPELPIPTYEQYLKICATYDKVPVIEIKTVIDNSDIDKIIELTKTYGLYEKSVIISFNLSYLLYVREHYDIKIQYLLDRLDEPQKIISLCVEQGFDLDIFYKVLTKEFIEDCHKHNILVNGWTVNDIETAERLIDWGIDFITTDCLL